MERLERAAIVVHLLEHLRARGSWCGETHVQKATYFLQEMTAVPLEYDFILYKHGPFSFDLHDEITEMRADEFIQLERQPQPYGPSIIGGPGRHYLEKRFGEHAAKYESHVSFVSAHLGNLGVSDLERVATALYVTLKAPNGSSARERAGRIVQLKPHVKPDQASQAVEHVDLMRADWREIARVAM